MPDKESLVPKDWFQRAEADLNAVEVLLQHGGDPQVAGSLLQQALEKYLKGYLLSKGWKLKKVHDLPLLLDEAVKYNPQLEGFRTTCEEITAYYFRGRYPFFTLGLNRKDVETSLKQVKELIQEILKGVKQWPSGQ
ncbi:MAG: HEPN domain-containing protein [Candidatus Brocadiales bacterium]